MGHREARNRDRYNKKNYPIQTYAITGHEHGKITGTSAGGQGAGKNLLDGPPMVITPTPPGAYAYDDDAWGSTFGASMDSTMTLYPGAKVKPLQGTALGTLQGEGQVFADAVPHADNMALYKDVLGKQQVRFLVSDNIATSQSADKVSDYSKVRSIGMRGPMQYGGWGKTIGMRTTDSDPTDFRKADDEHKLDMATWRYGPVDLRWDDVRKVWRGFNDLIADMPDSSKNEGTLVFGTNDDQACGFPYLKGKLEDVWWVRKTVDEAGIIGDTNDRLKSAKVLTHLAHNWFDLKKECYAPLNSIFLIHRDPSDETKCGTDTTFTSPAIELYHDVYFHHRACEEKHGPINFVCSDLDDCESEQAGRMVFSGGVWVPAVSIDVCSNCIGGSQFSTTFKNDIALANKICEVCQLVLKLHGFAKDRINPGDVGAAADAAGTAADSALNAWDAFGNIPDTGNSEVDDARDAARDAYDTSTTDHVNSEVDQRQSATDQSAANDAAGASTTAQEASDAADAQHASNFVDGDTGGELRPGRANRARFDAELADAANSAADAAREAARESQDKADASKAKADASRAEAEQSGKDAKEAHEDWKEERAKNDPPPLNDEEKAADEAGEQADADAEAAAEAGANANETPPSAKHCADVNAGEIANLVAALGGADGIANLAGGNGVTPSEVNDAINVAEQKINDSIQQAILNMDGALASSIDSVNDALTEVAGAGTAVAVAISTTGTAIGQNTGAGEAGTGDGGANTGQGDGDDTGTGDDGDVDNPPPPVPPVDPPPDPTGAGTTVEPRPGGGTIAHGPPGAPTVPRGPGDGTTVPPPTETPPPPDCGVITITDPCTNKTKVISCDGAGETDKGDGQPKGPDTTTPEGKPTTGDPGTGDGKPGLHGDPSGGTGLGLGNTGGGWHF